MLGGGSSGCVWSCMFYRFITRCVVCVERYFLHKGQGKDFDEYHCTCLTTDRRLDSRTLLALARSRGRMTGSYIDKSLFAKQKWQNGSFWIDSPENGGETDYEVHCGCWFCIDIAYRGVFATRQKWSQCVQANIVTIPNHSSIITTLAILLLVVTRCFWDWSKPVEIWVTKKDGASNFEL